MLTVIFYATNSAAAKLRSREIAAVKGNYSRVIDVGFWDGSYIKGDEIEIMPDVSGWQRDRITEVYGNKFVVQEDSIAPLQEEVEQEQLQPQPASTEKKAVHKGGGRWFVMAGEERLSGPHDKEEAQRLAAQLQEA